MNEEERTTLLIQIKEKLDNLIAAFEKVSNGTGFPRCVERAQRIMRLEQDVIGMKPKVESYDLLAGRVAALESDNKVQKDKKEKADVWLQRATWAVIIAGVVKFAFFG